MNNDTLIKDIGLSARLVNCLLNTKLTTVGDVRKCSDAKLFRIPNMGWKCIEELYRAGVLETYNRPLVMGRKHGVRKLMREATTPQASPWFDFCH